MTFQQPAVNGVGARAIQMQTTISVPDRGEALFGGYSFVSEGRNSFASPILSKSPYIGRGVGNVGYGRSMSRTTVSGRVRVIRLAEEEERQTGVRPRP
jgi:hypothetical protein